jgi:hypothetical protein
VAAGERADEREVGLDEIADRITRTIHRTILRRSEKNVKQSRIECINEILFG